MLSENLIKLYNTLALIETKGENTKTMAQCLMFTEQLANEARSAEIKAEENKKAQAEPVKEEE